MRSKVLVAYGTLLAVGLGLSLAAPTTAQDVSPSRVKGRTYDVWVSQGFATPPFAPFHDCASFTDTQMCIMGCGDCGTLTESGTSPSFWVGRVPCGGLNLVFIGTSFDGFGTPSSKPVIGASGVGTTERTTFGLEGVENPSCTLAAGAARNGQRYAAPR